MATFECECAFTIQAFALASEFIDSRLAIYFEVRSIFKHSSKYN